LARRVTETIGTANMPPVREQLGRLAAQAGMVEAMMHGMEAAGEHYGEWWIPNRHQLYSAQVITQDLYPKIINTIRELAGGAFIMLPSSFKDWTNPTLVPIIHKTQRSAAFEPEAKVKFLKAAWDAVGSEFGSRHTQYEMFYAGAQFVTAGHSFRTYGWKGATDLVDQLLASYSLADTIGATKQ
jgi:4-hydroxyphenylacetate 3-monooxygenase